MVRGVRFSDQGYVKDDDRDLDSAGILSTIKKGTEAANKIRREKGWSFGNDQGGVAFSDPLTHSGSVLHCAEWPLSISPEGVIAGSRQWPFDQITSVTANFDDVVIDGVRISAASGDVAAEIAAHLDELRNMPEGKRASCIRAAITHNLDVKDIKTTWDEFLKQTARLKRLAQAAFVVLFVIAPLSIVMVGPYPTWLFLFAGLMGLGLLSARQLFVLHRKYFPVARFDRWVQAISVGLFPVAATRAVDRLSKDLFYGRHPVAVICAVCQMPASDAVLREQLFDLSMTAAEPYREWYRSALLFEVSRVLDRAGFDASRQPNADDPAVTKFCPRCHSQFTNAAESCNDCDEVALIPLAQS